MMANPTLTPDWDALPELLLSTDAARILGVKTATLNQFVNRGKLSAPAQTGPNTALYRRDDIRAYWLAKNSRRAAVIPLAMDASPPATEVVAPPLHPADRNGYTPESNPPNALLAQPTEQFTRLISQAVAAGVRQGTEELQAELRALREELAAERAARPEPRTTALTEPKKSWMDRLFGR